MPRARVGQAIPLSESSGGLKLGVQSGGSDQWAGIFAKSPNSQVELFHAILTLPYSTIPEAAFNTGIYVQTSAAMVNYVTCYGQVAPNGFYWGAEIATGNANQATSYDEIYTGPTTTNGPSTADWTIVTNGSNLLQIYINGALVYPVPMQA